MIPLALNIADPTSFPQFDLADIKQYSRVDFEDLDNTIRNDLLAAAVRWAEDRTHRTIVSRVHTWVLDGFPVTTDDFGERIRLPRGRTQSVSSIAYVQNGNTTTLTGVDASPEGTGFLQDLRGDTGGLLMPPQGASWPGADVDHPSPVVITYTAGYATAAEVPASIRHAIYMYIADGLDMPGGSDYGPHTDDKAKERMLSPYRIHRWY